MHNNYCTLFDSHYLTRALALYHSLANSSEDFKLYVYCFDTLAERLIRKLQLPNVIPISLEEFETEDLLRVKETRTRAEYCWTCTPWIILDGFQRFQVHELTYLDADLYFFQKPSILLNEFHEAKASILLTEHRYTPQFDQTETSGRYCVQFMTFKQDERGMNALRWWADRCLEWCFAVPEPGRFGDQKYLDGWTTRFTGVHVLQHLGGGVAPWNVQQYSVSLDARMPYVNRVPVIFYHFHNLRWYIESKSRVDLFDLCSGCYPVSDEVVKSIYMPYLHELQAAFYQVRNVEPEFQCGSSVPERTWKARLRQLKYRIRRTYRVCELARKF